MNNSEEVNQDRVPQLMVIDDDAPEQPFTFYKLIPLGFNVFVTDNERNVRSMGILQQEVLRRYGTESHAEPKNKEDGVQHEEKSAMADKEMEESSKDENEEESETETEDDREQANLGIANRDGNEAMEDERAQLVQNTSRKSYSCMYPLLVRKYNENSGNNDESVMETDLETDLDEDGEADDEADEEGTEEVQRVNQEKNQDLQRVPGSENDSSIIITISDEEDENTTDGYVERFEAQNERRPVEPSTRNDQSEINASQSQIIEISDDDHTEENSESSEMDEEECTNMQTSGGGTEDGGMLMAQSQRAPTLEVGENDESEISDGDAQSQEIHYQPDCNYSIIDMDISEVEENRETEENDEDEMTTEESSESEGDSEVARINENCTMYHERSYNFRFFD